MKKCLFIGLIALICSCASKPASSPDELDMAIREASDYLNGRIPKGDKIAFINIHSDSPILSEYIIEGLIENTVNDNQFLVVDRQQLDVIRKELNFQYSGEVSDESAQAIGKLLGAKTIITGTVTQVGDLYRLRVRALAVESAQIQGQFSRNIHKSPAIAALLRNSSTTVSSTTTRTQPVTSTAQVVLTTIYKIGDTGPAGGIIFYDKGNNSGGWRYLETAPANTERELVSYGDTKPMLWAGAWNSNFYDDSLADRRPGAGKQNTRKMMETIAMHGGGINTAPWYCTGLSVNGFNDWYLPTLDELLLMYANLHNNSLGNFHSRKYWSSNSRNLRAGIDFLTGEVFSEEGSGSKQYVRAIRQF